jgi:hypothetical protein
MLLTKEDGHTIQSELKELIAHHSSWALTESTGSGKLISGRLGFDTWGIDTLPILDSINWVLQGSIRIDIESSLRFKTTLNYTIPLLIFLYWYS